MVKTMFYIITIYFVFGTIKIMCHFRWVSPVM